MRTGIVSTRAGVWALALVAVSTDVSAQQTPRPLSLAVVDVQALIENAEAAKKARAQIDQVRARYQQETTGKLEAIKKAYDGVAQERPTLSEEAYRQRLLELREKAAAHEREAREREGKVDAALRDALQKLAAAVEQVVNEVAKEQKLSAVLSRSSIIGTPAMPDITQQVLRRINQRTPSIAIDLPQ